MTHIEEPTLNIGQAQPAAVVKGPQGQEVYVDKFGKPVDNPGYNLKSDPRGYKKTGTGPKDKVII